MGTLDRLRVLVPPSRAEGNPLGGLLRRDGAEVIEFPDLAPELPQDLEVLDGAIAELGSFGWVLFTGSRSVVNFFGRPGIADVWPGPRIATLGGGAAAEARKRGFAIDYRPDRHVAEDVAAGWPDPAGKRILLVRAEGATADLPEALRARGAEVTAIDGYRMEVRADPAAARALRDSPPDLVALANGTAVRYLASALRLEVLAASRVAAVGESTARIAREAGLEPDLVAAGRIADLVRLIGTVPGHFFSRPGSRGDSEAPSGP